MIMLLILFSFKVLIYLFLIIFLELVMEGFTIQTGGILTSFM